MNKCTITNKTQFEDKKSAQHAIEAFKGKDALLAFYGKYGKNGTRRRKHNNGHCKQLRAYVCPYCNHYHITSQSIGDYKKKQVESEGGEIKFTNISQFKKYLL